MDLKKELSLSDLIPKRGPRPAKAQKPAKRRGLPKELVGLKIDSAGLSAAQVVNDGERRLIKVARAPLPPGS